MKKIASSIVLSLTLIQGVNAQTQTNGNAGASQATNLSLSNAIEISFYAFWGQAGSSAVMNFNNVNDYANGVFSGYQFLQVSSNKNFNVTVKANSSNFTYSGTTTPAPTMPVSVLNMGVLYNGTGGQNANGFYGSYRPLSTSPQAIITNGQKGASKIFVTRYKATPGFSYPAGTYSAEVVYTATQQ